MKIFEIVCEYQLLKKSRFNSKNSWKLLDAVDELIDAGVQPRSRVVDPNTVYQIQGEEENFSSPDEPLFPSLPAGIPVLAKFRRKLYVLDGHKRFQQAVMDNKHLKSFIFDVEEVKGLDKNSPSENPPKQQSFIQKFLGNRRSQ